MSMEAKRYRAEIAHAELTPGGVLRLVFRPEKIFKYAPGQFLSMYIPADGDSRERSRTVRRAYSFASPFESAAIHGYELCIKMTPGGRGADYLNRLRTGSSIEFMAPYGDFVYEPRDPSRGVCFIGTGSGIGPLRAMALAPALQESPPAHRYCLFGCRNQNDVLYAGDFVKAGIETRICLSQPLPGMPEIDGQFHGRVTEFLKTLPPDWPWHTTDFYICGSGQMIEDVRKILTGGHGVSAKALFAEHFTETKKKTA